MRIPHWQKVLQEVEEATRGELSTLIAGVDPDTHYTSAAYVLYDHACRDYRLFGGQVFKVAKKKTGSEAVCAMSSMLGRHGLLVGPDAAFIEDQLVRRSGQGRTKNPQNLIPLAQVAGACASHFGGVPAAMVQANDWKGSVGKVPNQSRTCETLGMEFEVKDAGYCVPLCTPERCYSVDEEGIQKDTRPSDWHHLLDAAGIAIWAHKKLIVQRAKVKARRRR